MSNKSISEIVLETLESAEKIEFLDESKIERGASGRYFVSCRDKEGKYNYVLRGNEVATYPTLRMAVLVLKNKRGY